ncbi:MAG TPA: energy transducer TonB [Terriglobales bacterium]|nr:energy transducer TonB [Terriglobales bacterium]
MNAFGKLVFAAGLLLFLAPHPALAQLARLDKTGKQFAAKFKHGKTRVAVVDFSSPAGSLPSQAHYLAWYLSSALQVRANDHLRVTDHLEFDREIATIRNSSVTSLSPDALSEISSRINEDVLILGTLEKKDASYVLSMNAVRVSNGNVLDSESTEIDASPFLESLSIPLQPKDGQLLTRSGAKGVQQPHCDYCPDPSYDDLAREAKVQGVCILETIISPEGTIQQIHPLKLIGYGLDEKAYEKVATWRLEPPRNKDGTPISLVVPVEVTFRLY